MLAKLNNIKIAIVKKNRSMGKFLYLTKRSDRFIDAQMRTKCGLKKKVMVHGTTVEWVTGVLNT